VADPGLQGFSYLLQYNDTLVHPDALSPVPKWLCFSLLLDRSTEYVLQGALMTEQKVLCLRLQEAPA
jgi:hypothetical protein